jgi:transcriptional regulator with XRE-family HTH domain
MQTNVIAAYVRELRKGYRHTQQSLADTAGVGKRTVERLDRGDKPVSLRSMEPIMATLGAPPDEVNYLLTNPSATVDEAIELAQARLQRNAIWNSSIGQTRLAHADPRLLGVQIYVRTVRERQGISRKTIADQLGIGMGVLADWEDGRSAALPLPAVVRAVTLLGGTLDDLKQIDSSTHDHEALGRQLAEARVQLTVEQSELKEESTSEVLALPLRERTLLQRIAAIEGIIQFMLSLLKRALPTEASDIERIAAHWFQSTSTDTEEQGV